MPPHPKAAPLAVSPDGRSIYDADGCVHTIDSPHSPQSALCEPNDGYEGLKFARFIDNDIIAVGFWTGYYFDGFGSAGATQSIIEVLVRTSTPTWDLVACQRCDRTIGDGFELRDIAWHPSGVLAWLAVDGELSVSVGRRPPEPFDPRWGEANPAQYPEPGAMRLEAELFGAWDAIRIDRAGRALIATGDDDTTELDLDAGVYRSGDGPWKPIPQL